MSTGQIGNKDAGLILRLFPWIIFLGAFLAFAVQPMEGKALLPWFGGSSSVWATGLLFFTGVLFLGYLYVYLLARFAEGRQILIHRCVVALVLVASLLSLLLRRSFRPDLGWTLDGAIPPHLAVLLSLFLSVGPPYFLLATTSPLLQYWWGRATSGEPYRLYSLSNIGSLLALLSYPILIEPRLSLNLQSAGWHILFVAYGALYLYATYLVPASQGGGKAPNHRGIEGRGDRVAEDQVQSGWKSGEGESPSTRGARLRPLTWIGYAALPAFLLVAVTTHITQVVAPVPLLWTMPLALYLVSFILAFRGVGRSSAPLLLLLLSTGLVVWAESGDRTAHAEVQLFAALLLLFSSGLAFHSRLYALRPTLSKLPLFYLLLSIGGVVGTLGASLLPPLLFPDLWEYPLGVALAVGAGGRLLTVTHMAARTPKALTLAGQVGWVLLAGYTFMEAISSSPANQLARSRNFYGTAMVSLEGDMVVLSHGKTRHGSQFADEERAPIPTAYYAPTSGVGRAAIHLQSREEGGSVRFGLVGLGAGTLAAYCRPRDTFVFYEIDPRITAMARRYFTYLQMCPGVAVRHGDARILLEGEERAGALGGYDLLAIDAFSDDAIPVHLLTVEAFRLYLAHLNPNGILAVHTSNIYIELAPVAIRIAEELGWSSLVVRDWTLSSPGAAGSDWVLLARNRETFLSPPFANVVPYLPGTQAPLWTDTYSSILPLLRGYRFVTERLEVL